MGKQAIMTTLSEDSAKLDGQNPWPGLAAYQEASRAFFFGRDEEAAELFRLIRLSPLTVVYGKSGLGKTSLLQAGLYPKLREQHYLPIHVRLEFVDVMRDRPLQQVMRRLKEELAKEKAEYPEPRSEHSLWEYLHRKDLEIWSRDNFPLIPVLVFDQFEELFSHGSSDVRLINHVFDSLADLIENRIPTEVVNKEPGILRSSLDLLSQRYRIVLSFREDFLPEVQAWEQKAPSLLKNYLRLNPMSRERAIEAVTLAGKEVLDEGVAPSIVDLVGKRDHSADTANTSEMVIEPVLLSLCCSRLNCRRTGAKIDQALIQHTGQDILDGFYREALDDDTVKGPPDVALFIEDYLIQGDHYRGDYPKEEALEKKFLTMDQLTALTGRHRLLRIVHHPDTTRVELIHDRLVPVVRKARDERKIKQHQEEQERLTREAQAKAATLKRIGLLIALLLFITVGSAFWLYHANGIAQSAQQHAEQLLGFLLSEQFLGDIRDVGRSSMLEQVNSRVQSYVKNRDQRTALVRGLALRNEGDIERMHGKTMESLTSFEQALNAIESSPETPDRAREAARTRERLGEALAVQGHLAQALEHYEAAITAWENLYKNNHAKVEDCISFADSLVSTGDLKNRQGKATLASKDLAKAINIVTTVPFGRCVRVSSNGEPYPTVEALVVLSHAQMLRAAIYYSEADFAVAVRLASEAKSLSPTSITVTRQKATALASWANSKVFDTPHYALKDYREVLGEFDLLRRRDPSNHLWEREQAAVQLLIAEGIVACRQIKTKDCKSKSSIEEAEVTNLKAMMALKSLAETDPSNLSLQRDLAWALQGRAKVLAMQAQLVESLTALQESKRLYTASILDLSDAEGVLPLGLVLLDQSKVFADLGKWAEAKATLKESNHMLKAFEEKIGAGENNFSILSYMIEVKTQESKLLRKAGDKKDADLADEERKRLEASLNRRYQDLLEGDKQEAEKLTAAHIDNVNRGAKLYEQGDYAAALREFETAESAMQKYITLNPTFHKGYDNLRNVYDWVGLMQERLGNTREVTAAGRSMLDMARTATLLNSGHDAQSLDKELNRARRILAVSLYQSKGFKEHIDETMTLVQQEITALEGNLQNHLTNVDHLADLSNAYWGQGLIRIEAGKAGWEDSIRIGILYLQRAMDIQSREHKYLNRLGEMRKYLADELDADGLKEKALAEYRLALKAYQQAAKLSPGDETALKGVGELAELGVR
jgi:tetratricopeptide (TPR) repeat protein